MIRTGVTTEVSIGTYWKNKTSAWVHHSHNINLTRIRKQVKTDGGYAEMPDGAKEEMSG